MIPFFRKIRYRLAKNNQFLKYSRYAVGEIVLVVIGILIALQINTWNEKRLTENQIEYLLKKVQVELKLNIDNSINILEYNRKIDSLYYYLHHDSLATEDVYENPNYALLTLYYNNLTIVDKAYLNLMGIDGGLSEKHDSIISLLQLVYVINKQDVDITNEDMRDFNSKSSNYLIQNKNWYSQLLTNDLNDEIINFFLHDSYAKNNLEQFALLSLNEQTYYDNIFRINAIKTYRYISQYLYEKRGVKTKSLVNEMNYKQYVGLYQRGVQTVEVLLEQGKIYTIYKSHSESNGTKREIFPISNYCFMREKERGFNYFLFNKKKGEFEYVYRQGALNHRYSKLR